MKKSLETLKRELKFVTDRILLIRQGKVREDRGLSLKEAMAYQKDYETAISILEESLKR